MFRFAVVGAVLMSVAVAASVAAEPVTVRNPEGSMQASPVLRSQTGETLAAGEFIQRASDDGRVETSLVLRFHDGSVYEEHVTFTQRDALELQRYRVIQRGPSFPDWLDATVDRTTGRYDVHYRSDDEGRWQKLTGTLTLPADTYNGMLPVLLKQLTGGAPHNVQIVAFTPRPRFVTVRATPAGEEALVIRERLMTTTRYQLKPQLGIFASLLIADIPPAYLWVAPGDVSEFVRFQGPLYFMGPVWRIEER